MCICVWWQKFHVLPNGLILTTSALQLVWVIGLCMPTKCAAFWLQLNVYGSISMVENSSYCFSFWKEMITIDLFSSY